MLTSSFEATTVGDHLVGQTSEQSIDVTLCGIDGDFILAGLLRGRQHSVQFVVEHMPGCRALLLVLHVCAATALPSHPWRSRSHKTLREESSSGLFFESQLIDHFAPDGSRHTWRQRYFVNDTFWIASGRAGPVFLCVGGEGSPLSQSVVVTGDGHCADAVTIASRAGALVLALEHRFYGVSVPTADLTSQSLQLLSAQQALADIAVFHSFITARYQLDRLRHRWLAFGGSYPGMLAAWSRTLMPHLIHGAVASSAPVGAVLNYRGYNDVVGAALETHAVGGSSECGTMVRAAFADLGSRLKTVAGRRMLETLFPVCNASGTVTPLEDEVAQRSLAEDLSYLFPAQSNDPTCASPGCNIAGACHLMRDSSLGSPLQRLAALAATQLSPGDCIGEGREATTAALTNTTLEGGIARIWFWQTCTQFGFYQTCDPDSQCPFMSEPHFSTLDANLADCATAFGPEVASSVSTAVAAALVTFGGLTPSATRLLFVNGEIDPWRAASISVSPGAGVDVQWVAGASHHAWTHPPKRSDSSAIVAARRRIEADVRAWLREPANTPLGSVWGEQTAGSWTLGSVINIGAAILNSAVAGAMAVLAVQSCRQGRRASSDEVVAQPRTGQIDDSLHAPLLEHT